MLDQIKQAVVEGATNPKVLLAGATGTGGVTSLLGHLQTYIGLGAVVASIILSVVLIVGGLQNNRNKKLEAEKLKRELAMLKFPPENEGIVHSSHTRG